MNIIELQDNLKDLPDRVLMQEMQMPTGNMPQFLVLSELTRRRRMRDEYNRQKAVDMPTVAEEVMTASGVPQGGITAIARNMAPNSSIAQNTSADMAVQREPTRMPQMMADGGILNLFSGGRTRGAAPIEDMYRQVEPYPENNPDPRARRNWNLMYGMTHNLDGTPKTISPNAAMTEMNQNIGDVSADIGDFMPTVPDASQDPSTDLDIGGILAGAQQFDFDRPFAQQDTTTALPIAAPDFDATDENDILDAEEARLVQQEVLDANRGDQPLPDISQIDPETNLDISAALGIGSLGTNLADAINNPIGDLPFLPPPTESAETESERLLQEDVGDFNRTSNVLTEQIDPVEEQGILSRLFSNPFSNPLVDLNTEKGRNRTRTERTSDTLDSFYPELPVPASDVKPPMPLLENVLDQGRSIPEMPIDPSSVMPPMMGDTGGEETAAPMMPTGTDSYGALESRIAKMLADREKAAESDKYLALAQAGLALMASDSPTLAGAIGEAGLVGIGQLRDARSQYDKDVLELLSTQADIDSARADRNLQLQELALERDELAQTREASEALSKYRMASLDPRNASISDLQAGLNYINGEIQTQATTVTYDEISGEEIEKIDMTKVDPQLLIQKKSLEDSLLTRLRGTGADFDATGS